jgi:hypothetical protein
MYSIMVVVAGRPCFQVPATFFGHIPDSVAVAQYNTILRLVKEISTQKYIYRMLNPKLLPSPRDGILEAYFYRSLHVFLYAIFSPIFIRIFPPRWFFALEFSMTTANKGGGVFVNLFLCLPCEILNYVFI